MDDLWKTNSDFKSALKQSYKAAKVRGAPKNRSIGSLIWTIGKKVDKRAPPKAEIALKALDDLISDALLWFHLLSGTLLSDRKKIRPSNKSFAKAFIPLLMRIIQDSIVIRNLICDGYDVQARSLLRSLDEHVDALVYLSLDPDLSEKFIETNDEESSNKFWYEHIRGVGKEIESRLASMLSVQLKEIRSFKLSERRMLNSIHHPSHWACTVPLMTPSRGGGIADHIHGTRSEFSYRTAKYLFYTLGELAVFINFLVPEIRALTKRRKRNRVSDFIPTGFNHLAQMLFSLIENWNAPMFSDSPQLKKVFEFLPKD